MKNTPRLSTLSLALVVLLSFSACNKAPEADKTALPNVYATTPNVADVDVTTNVTTALLGNAELRAFGINVITLKGDVRLIGAVDTPSQIETAIRLTRESNGVHAIHNELTLKK